MIWISNTYLNSERPQFRVIRLFKDLYVILIVTKAAFSRVFPCSHVLRDWSIELVESVHTLSSAHLLVGFHQLFIQSLDFVLQVTIVVRLTALKVTAGTLFPYLRMWQPKGRVFKKIDILIRNF